MGEAILWHKYVGSNEVMCMSSQKTGIKLVVGCTKRLNDQQHSGVKGKESLFPYPDFEGVSPTQRVQHIGDCQVSCVLIQTYYQVIPPACLLP